MTLTAEELDSLAEYEPAPQPEFWGARPELATIYQFARGRRVGPWAVLGGVLARVAASAPPSVVLPPLVGGYGSINLFVGIVAASGGGKGASQAAASSLVELFGEPFVPVTLGSGEGIAHAYVKREQTEKGQPAEVIQHTNSVLFDVPEVDTFTAISKRQGSTLAAELRKLWSGERLGFQNADATRRMPVDAHAYRAALILGIQPGRAGALLDDADGGTPQRFLWFPATDPDAPDELPPLPSTLKWSMPGVDVLPVVHGFRVMDVCDVARRTVDRHRLAVLRGEGDALDGHALLSRLKAAAALALLDGRGNVDPEDWRLAGVVMAVSDNTRSRVREYLADVSRRSNRARAEARAEGEVIVAERIAEHDRARVARGILRRLAKAPDGLTAGELRRAAKSKDRPDVEPALVELLDAGAVTAEAVDYRGQSGTRYWLAQGVDRSEVDQGVDFRSTPQEPQDSAVSRGGPRGGPASTPHDGWRAS